MSRGRFLLLCGCAVLLLIVGGMALYAGGRRLESGDVEDVRGDLSTRFEDTIFTYNDRNYIPRTNITAMLLMGVDLTEDSNLEEYLTGGQADFLLLLILDHNSKVVRQLQIDRDTNAEYTVLTPQGGVFGTTRRQICLSHAYGKNRKQGAELTVDAVERLLCGIDIDLYMSFDADAIGVLNDALGGVTVTVKEDFTEHDPQMYPGATLRLNAKQAVLFTRHRMDVGDGTNAARMVRQQEFLSSATKTLEEKMGEDVNYVGKLFDELADVMTTNVRRGRLINEANKAYHYDILPVVQPQGEYIVGTNGKRAFEVDEAALINWVLESCFQPAD